jgi:hypothetical protein
LYCLAAEGQIGLRTAFMQINAQLFPIQLYVTAARSMHPQQHLLLFLFFLLLPPPQSRRNIEKSGENEKKVFPFPSHPFHFPNFQT